MEGKTVVIEYTNWKGETRKRPVEPMNIWYGRTQWHPDNGWLLTAVDLEDGTIKDFAMAGIRLWEEAKP